MKKANSPFTLYKQSGVQAGKDNYQPTALTLHQLPTPMSQKCYPLNHLPHPFLTHIDH